MDYVRNDVCGVDNCRTNLYYIEDGLWFCKNGHRKEGFIETQPDEDDFGTQGRKSRKQKEEREAIEKGLSGPKAWHLFLFCYQLILWKQVHWLVHEQGFPPELETVVRDLWALRLQKFQSKVEDGSDSESQQVFYTSTSQDSDSAPNDGLATGRANVVASNSPRLIDTLGLCYLGTLLLRLAVSLGDFHQWVKLDEIVYFRAIHAIPKNVRAPLPASFQTQLDRRAALAPGRLHRSVRELASLYQDDFDITFPALNLPLLLLRYIRELAMPISIYPAVIRLAQSLGVTFSVHSSSHRFQITDPPEIQLMSLVIIAVKLIHGFDLVERPPQTETEPAALGVDWIKWQEAFAHGRAPAMGRSHVTRGEEINATEETIFQMKVEELDQYMDWYAKTWLEDDKSKVPPQLLDFFPIERSPVAQQTGAEAEESEVKNEDATDKLKLVFKSLKIRPNSTEGEASRSSRPGSHYRLYRTAEELPPFAAAVYHEAARIIGLGLKELVRAVFLTEIKLRREAGGEAEQNGEGVDADDEFVVSDASDEGGSPPTSAEEAEEDEDGRY